MARKRQRIYNPSPVAIVAIAAAATIVTGGVVYGMQRWRRAIGGGMPTPGDDVPAGPVEPGVQVPKVYVTVKTTLENGYLQVRVVEGQNVTHLHEDLATAVVEAPQLPLDVVFSVPASFDLIGGNDLQLTPAATLVAGQPGVTRDIIVRVSQRSDTMSAFSPQVAATVKTSQSASESVITRIPVYVV